MKISELQASNPAVYNTDKFSCHSYADFYDNLFSGKEDADLNILEIGIDKGGSVRLWHDYLKKAKITGCDIVDMSELVKYSINGRIAIGCCNAYDSGSKFIGEYDVIVDDGPHTIESQIYALQNFPAYLKPGGILVIEDVPEWLEAEIIKHAPAGGMASVVDLRSVKNRWDDCLIVFKKDE